MRRDEERKEKMTRKTRNGQTKKKQKEAEREQEKTRKA